MTGYSTRWSHGLIQVPGDPCLQTWLDDQFLVSGSRDGSLALWRVTEEMVDQVGRHR